jgi:hypothetical protein
MYRPHMGGMLNAHVHSRASPIQPQDYDVRGAAACGFTVSGARACSNPRPPKPFTRRCACFAASGGAVPVLRTSSASRVTCQRTLCAHGPRGQPGRLPARRGPEPSLRRRSAFPVPAAPPLSHEMPRTQAAPRRGSPCSSPHRTACFNQWHTPPTPWAEQKQPRARLPTGPRSPPVRLGLLVHQN